MAEDDFPNLSDSDIPRIHLAGETVLIVEDVDDEFDFTHLDIV